jgi:ATP-dependent Lhr-like helicase
VAVRTGDTPQKERQRMLRHPPDILITTPESLFLMLTSQAREILGGVETLILDEVHAVAGTKRGATPRAVGRATRAPGPPSADRVSGPVQRIGLSATQRPLVEIGRFVAGGREIQLVDAGRAQGARPRDRRAARRHDRSREGSYNSVWPSIYPEILKLVSEHRSTIVSSTTAA